MLISKSRSSNIFTLSLLLVFIFYIRLIYKDIEISNNNNDNIWSIPNLNRNLYDKGIVMCANEENLALMTGLQYIIKKIRNEYLSNIYIEIAHCNEISMNTQSNIINTYKNILFNNICEKSTSLIEKKRLRSWFCKPMALITSSFNESMIIDTDTLWFKNPVDLFESYGYIESGGLFFRDRLLYELKDEINNPNYDQRKGLRYKDVLTFIETHSNMNFKLTPEKAIGLYNSNGISYYWKHGYNNSAPIIRQVQESSVVLMNRNKMPKTIHILSKLIPSFGLGYGDKEIYWISATIANEKFSWEPYIAGIYGDCGEIFHYNPINKYNKDNTNVDPYYLNGEYLVQISNDKDGRGIQEVYSKPVSASNFELFEMGEYFKQTGGRCGACIHMGCQPIPDYVNNEILNYQKYQRINVAEKITNYDRIKKILMNMLTRLLEYI